MKITPSVKFEFEKDDIALGILFRRENESKKFIRKNKVINYQFGIMFLWFALLVEIRLERGN